MGGEAVPGLAGEVGVGDRLVLGVGNGDGASRRQLDGCLVEAAEAGQRPGPRLVGVDEVEVVEAGGVDDLATPVGVVQGEVAMTGDGVDRDSSHDARAAFAAWRRAARRQ